MWRSGTDVMGLCTELVERALKEMEEEEKKEKGGGRG